MVDKEEVVRIRKALESIGSNLSFIGFAICMCAAALNVIGCHTGAIK